MKKLSDRLSRFGGHCILLGAVINGSKILWESLILPKEIDLPLFMIPFLIGWALVLKWGVVLPLPIKEID